MNLSRIYEQLYKHEIVSFDVFDTLIARCVGKPHEVFTLMERELCLKYGNKIRGFANKRMAAAKKAAAMSKYGEITLEEIYDFMKLNNKQEIIDYEKMVEIEVSAPNDEMFDLYLECCRMGKRIMICSDMYLNKATIEEILVKNGYTGYEKLYLSSDRKKRKSDGGLYFEMVRDLQINPKSIFHIGDNFESDYIQAVRCGVDAFYYTPPKRIKNIGYPFNILYGDMTIKFQKKYYWQQIGKYSLGNFLYGYVSWLVHEMQKQNYDRIFFLSRDGYMMLKAIEMLNIKDLVSKSVYLYVSRRSLIIPILHLYNGYEARCKTMSWIKHFDIKYFLENFGLDYEHYGCQIKHLVADETKIYERSELFSNRKLLDIYNALEGVIEDNSRREYRLLVRYLKQNAFTGKVAVVDAGWFGHLQNALETVNKSADLGADIDGYYIGIKKNCQYFRQQKMHGYLYFGKEQMQNQKHENLTTMVVEAFHSRDEGSVKCYEEKSGNVVPVLKTNNLNDEGHKVLYLVQEAAVTRVKYLAQMQDIRIANFDSNVYFYGFYRLCIKPNLYDAWKLGRFIEENQLHGMIYYLFHPNCLKKDTQKMNWKLGQLKRVLKIKMNYMKFYELLDR